MENQNPPISPIPAPNIVNEQQPTSPIENSNRSFWKTIGIGMAIVSFCTAIAVIGYFVVLSKNKSAQVLTPQIIPIATPTPTVDPTANWQTYTSNDGSFSIKYPAEQYVNCGKGEFVLFTGKECNAGEGQPFIQISTNPAQKDYQKSNYPECYVVNKETIQIGGANSTKYFSVQNPDQAACNVKYTTPLDSMNIANAETNHRVNIIVEKNNNKYEIGLIGDLDAKLTETRNKMVSTFKFTDPNSSSTPTASTDLAIKQAIAQKVSSETKQTFSAGQFQIIYDDTSKFGDNYASGNVHTVGYGGGNHMWAANINGQWTIVAYGQTYPTCSQISQYTLPKDFLPCAQ